uniref:Uncharacterized protein n=1 Tax=Glossina austeni TaxID=7395 RepID=A0A1A9V3H8_GLOAU
MEKLLKQLRITWLTNKRALKQFITISIERGSLTSRNEGTERAVAEEIFCTLEFGTKWGCTRSVSRCETRNVGINFFLLLFNVTAVDAVAAFDFNAPSRKRERN